ncbi:glycosyltransferase family 2 protein [Cellulomonas triticagri]|uniref:Glycosyltransferase family 2 protein n=1 Tax=Cellulomonas triticagri TaxID=2483352 RepID=A0A3M2J3V2_9CELL|nr:glycosyltransferase family 2 protein [Cellulomonas triticagri]RMI06761.1 glycosyltransferase family 2 protein [Cellulomonas triticagri]
MAKQHRGTTVSVVLIVKDEERVLATCLESVAWADEVVVYDTGSSDRTVEIARAHATTVVEGYWDGDFGAARNRATEHATGDWVFSIDADEVFEGDGPRVRRRLATATADIFAVLIQDATASVFDPSESSVSARVFRRDVAHWRGELHEQVVARPGVDRHLQLQALPSVVLRHSGYAAATIQEKQKDERNLSIALHDLEVAVERGMSDAEIATRRANVARSYVMHGEFERGLDEGVAALKGDHLSARTLVQLAGAMVIAAMRIPDQALEEKWLDLWEAAEGNAAWVLAARARSAAVHDDAPRALDLLDRVPRVTTNVDGQRLERRSLARVETWALQRVGRRDEALAVAVDAVAHDIAPGEPADLATWFGTDGVRELLGHVRPEQWSTWALRCAANATRPALLLLDVMRDLRPDSGAVLVSAATLPWLMTLEEATQWAVALRGAGLEDRCTLVALAEDDHREPRDRALAAALAFDVYADQRALAALERALPLVPEDQEAALAAELEIVAPGLVGAPA